MYLKKLEILGFKSFAQKTILDFECGVSVIVGPNGSGKSNVADALRFVLGEQGMRNVRAKKSEDLIFSGSETKSKMNMAQASLYFDNKDRVFPVDFSEVLISRKIFRDGENQYFINNSQVRLKDLAEFIAKAKLGLKGYTIINQGMGDQILNASPSQKKEIIDDSLGLKEFQIKKNGSILKLSQTKNNLEKAESLIRELTPHLKFLKKQVDKLEEKVQLEKRLTELEEEFFNGKFILIKKELEENNDKKKEQEDLSRSLKNELEKIENELSKEEKKVSTFFSELENEEKKLFELESKKSSLQRKIGKLEGVIDFQKRSKKQVPLFVPLDISYIKKKLQVFKNLITLMLKNQSLGEIKKKIKELDEYLNILTTEVESGKIKQVNKNTKIEKNNFLFQREKLENEKEGYLKNLNNLEKEFSNVKERIKQLNLSYHKEKENIFTLRENKNEKTRKFYLSQNELNNLNRERERLNEELKSLNREKPSVVFKIKNSSLGELVGETLPTNLSNISREIDKIKIRLETADLIDESIVKEYEEVSDRLKFLNKEVSDLKDAFVALNSAISKLNIQIEDKFKNSFNLINKNFNKYFNILFGGGRASLELIKIDKNNEQKNEKREKNFGIELNISLPGKKINSISVLSGGERTLTSLAFLFALISTSPPPFLVLDEIDAPLDEANSNRFLEILEELKKHTQFIMITHNRESMRQADVLYGVTMQDDGISKLLSLKFKDAKELVA